MRGRRVSSRGAARTGDRLAAHLSRDDSGTGRVPRRRSAFFFCPCGLPGGRAVNSRIVPLLVLIALLGTAAAVSSIVLFDQVEHLSLFVLVPLMFLIGAVPIAVRVWKGS